LGVTITEATLVEWLVAEGDQVEVGTPIYVLATDKVDNEVESPVSGRIELLVEADALYPVGTRIATIT
jgi:pyruvate/2-oxoglutarate dehydrogenase complex dihydrolipoamide acyltransferase (E2) component